MMHSAGAILRSFILYRPLRTFSLLGALFFAAGIALGARYLYFAASGSGAGHVQSVVLAAVLLIVGIQIFLIGLLADMTGSNRRILEENLFRTRRMELDRAAAERGKRRAR
jgi:hypothetical protein